VAKPSRGGASSSRVNGIHYGGVEVLSVRNIEAHPTCSTKSLTGVNLPIERRGDSILKSIRVNLERQANRAYYILIHQLVLNQHALQYGKGQI
jgi:hypothetical protein